MLSSRFFAEGVSAGGCRCSRRGGASVPARFSGGDGRCSRICRGRPVCRPEPGPSQESFTGGHIGPPLRGVGAFRNNGNRCRKGTFPNGAGRSPSPTGESEQAGPQRGEVAPPYGGNLGAGRQRGGKGNTQIWGEKFHFGLANLYLVVYTESETKDIVAREQGAALRAKGTIPPESCGFPAFFRGSPRSGHVFSRESGKERG